uniref:NADH-ubiquinone oxidoreductase chain 6 n=1 Tax=Dolichosciara megumiae TaxID=2715056 RepID=A0A6G7GBK5_9DIPT|nr:NADH dehydrogenase subunit 6 [Dolichosciara megumiae]QIH95787.1 NADH dehydrogenase subunit 6 [Dolichosciara megumiae]
MNFMVLSMLNLLLIISSLIFSQLKHPLAMGFLLLVQTVLISMITGLMINSFWFSYILFLVFLGGMLVLFIYVTSLASNEVFKFSIKLMLLTFSFLIMFMSVYYFVDLSLVMNLFKTEMDSSPLSNILSENMELIYKLYNFPTNWMTSLMINYLLFTLIVVVKVTQFFYGPLRNLN